MTADDHTCGAVGLEAAHWSEPRLQSTMVAFDPVVGVPVGVVDRAGQQVDNDVRQRGRAVGDDLVGMTVRVHGLRDKRPCCGDVATSREQDVDDLAMLVHSPVHVTPHAGDFL